MRWPTASAAARSARIAAQSAVTGFLEDYYCTSDAWSVKTSAERVLVATNSWLHSQTRQGQHRYDRDRGYVCTFSALVIKSTTAHLFHVGDARIYRLRGETLEQLTEDHRVWVSSQQSYLARALGMDRKVEIDYQPVPLEAGDLFVLATDGVYEHVDAAVHRGRHRRQPADLDAAAAAIVDEALRRGSADNLTVQIVRVDELPRPRGQRDVPAAGRTALPAAAGSAQVFDGYRIVREMHAQQPQPHLSRRRRARPAKRVVIKMPSIDLRDDPAYLERFLMEEWVARRIDSPHVLKPGAPTRKRHFLYVVTEFIDGQTLAQWMIDHPKPDLETVRGIVEQIAKGLRAFHRLEMLHQDLRPENIMIDATGTVKIIDFGSTRVAGVMEVDTAVARHRILGTAQYTAPEYFLGEDGTPRSDLFSLGVIAYQMLTGRLPYGAARSAAPPARPRSSKLVYTPPGNNRDIPAWIDEASARRCSPIPAKRYDELSEFVFDLRHPNQAFLSRTRPPLIERNPLVFWKAVSFVLAVLLIMLVMKLAFQ